VSCRGIMRRSRVVLSLPRRNRSARFRQRSRAERHASVFSNQSKGDAPHVAQVDSGCLCTYYLFMSDINTRALDRELKRGSAELLMLSLLDARPRHGYDLSKLIHTRSGGQLTFHIDSLYPLLYRLEERGWIKGTWVERPDERRRRFYKVTPEGRRVLAQQRKTWAAFVEAVRRVTGDEHA
jgi:PadR family transcriptional regulator PadR